MIYLFNNIMNNICELLTWDVKINYNKNNTLFIRHNVFELYAKVQQNQKCLNLNICNNIYYNTLQ